MVSPCKASSHWLRYLLLVWLVTALTGCSSRGLSFTQTHKLTEPAQLMRAVAGDHLELPRELAKRLAGPYIVEPGDVLLVQPANFDSPARLPGDQPILPDGTINLGQYGHLQVAGQTIETIEKQAQALVQGQTKDAGPITVRLISRQSKVFYVLGEVNAPGSFILTGRETSLDAILIAGGLTDNASRDKIILSRPTPPDGCRAVLAIRYNDIVQLGDTTTNYQIQAGDRIFVPSKTFCEDLPFYKSSKDAGCRPQVPCGDGGPVMGMPDPHLSAPATPSFAPVQGAFPWMSRRRKEPATVQPVLLARPYQ